MDSLIRVDSLLYDISLEIITRQLNIRVVLFTRVYPNKSWQVNSHSHEDFELHFITSGRGRIELQNREFSVSAGDFFITGPHVSHAHYSDAENPMEEYCLECMIEDDCGLSETLAAAFSHPYRSDEVFRILALLADEAINRSSARPIALQGLVILLISKLYSVVSRSDILHPAASSAQRLESITGFIRENYAGNITLHDAAAALFLCEKQINRIMKRGCNETFHRHLIRVRLEQACSLIRENTLNMDQIAESCGFSDKRYMYQAFKRNGLLPPGAYRGKKRPENGPAEKKAAPRRTTKAHS